MTINPNNIFNPTNTSAPSENTPHQNREQPANARHIDSLASNILNNIATNNPHPLPEPLPLGTLSGPFREEERFQQERRTFEKSLNDWVNDPSVAGYKDEAARRIESAYYNQSDSLDLENLDLTSIPESIGSLSALTWLYLNNNRLTSIPDSIGSLSALTLLNLSYNRLTSIPESIGSLSRLTWLYLQNNRLTSIPDSIGSLSALTWLCLNNNRLASIPDSIGSLSALKRLKLYNNQLTSIPDSIGSLSTLKRLFLSNNQLTSLPTSIGNLLNLKILAIHENSSLRELPLSFGNIPDIRVLYISGTQIPPEIQESILALCRSLVDQEASNVLPTRLKAWKQHANSNEGRNYDLDFIFQMPEEKTKTINEWLLRLSKTCDFRNNQSKLAHFVCSMLETLKDNEEFSKLFFDQVEANNEHCQDRAAMSLNEIYSCWKLHTINQNDSQDAKLALLAGIAKTNALRIALSKTLANKNIYESVEIYLYYETTLKDELGLVTAINNMAYKAMGNCNWINKNDLKEEVQNTYLKILVEIPEFERLALLDDSYSKERDSITNRYQALMENLKQELANPKNPMNEWDYNTQTHRLLAEREKEISILSQEWAMKHLAK